MPVLVVTPPEEACKPYGSRKKERQDRLKRLHAAFPPYDTSNVPFDLPQLTDESSQENVHGKEVHSEASRNVHFPQTIPEPQLPARTNILLSPPVTGMPTLLERLCEEIRAEFPELLPPSPKFVGVDEWLAETELEQCEGEEDGASDDFASMDY